MRILIALALTVFLYGCGDSPNREWETTANGAYTASISPNGEYVVVGSLQHGGSLWRLKDGERLYNWNHAGGQYSKLMASTFSTDSRYALTAEKKRFVMWEVSTGKAAGFWPAEGGVLSMALSDNGRYAIIGQENYSALYIDTATGAILNTLTHSGDINAVAISANGLIGVTGSEDGIIKVWDLPEGKETFAYQMGDDISAVAISQDASLVFASLYYGMGKIWQTKTGKEVSSVGHNRTTITSATFSNDNKQLLTGFTARRVMLWDVTSGKSLKSWRADAPLFWRPTGLVVNDVAFGSKPNHYLNVFSNGLVYEWK
jgi:WD40 repeat protein